MARRTPIKEGMQRVADQRVSEEIELVGFFRINCTGKTDQFDLKKGTYTSGFFACDSKQQKANAIIDLLAKVGFTGAAKPCTGGCDDSNEECRPQSLKFTLVKGRADLGIAEVTLFDTKYCQYVLAALQDSEIVLTVGCGCIPKVR
jgi:hypothetical protein